ncbi:histone deacetylase complex [Scheffersomyces xylosifermentans]|uniref:histone deacetylase complex n=1 Tax=Scheffersomyces xylosifermentans TaxID=1304137 RepID=UPI00315DC35D
MTNKEEEQLLQDASTLLMFANVAAKQQQQHIKNVSPPPQQQSQSTTHSPVLSANTASPVSVNISPSLAPVGTLPGILHQQETHPAPGDVTVTATPSSSTVTSTTSSENIAPPPNGFASPMAGAAPPAVKSSISILMNSPEPQQMPFPIQTTKVQPPVLVPYNLPISSRKSVSPPSSYNSNLPSKGSFTQNHKRSKSTPETDKRPVSAYRKILLSPGTANVTLARGINLQTGERNTNNAVIAAAALAAAADNPLPLKHLVENSITIEKVEEKKKRAHEASKSEAIPEGNIEQQQSIEQEPDHNNKQLEKEKLETEADDTKIQEQDDEEEQEEEESKAKGVTFSVPPLSSYQVDPDSGLIGCICGIIDDDGFTIQCDVCYRWQHCVCMGFKTSDEVPEDEYSCYYCDEQKWGKFDPSVCRYKTLERLGGEQRQEQQNQHLEESDDAQDNKQKQQNTGAGTKRKQSNSEKSDKKRKVEAADKQRKDNILAMDIPVKSQSPVDMLPNKENELLDDGITAESYQSVYYKLRSNDYKKQSIREFLSKEGIDFFKEFSALPKEEQGTGKLRGITVMPLSQFKAIKLSKLILPNQQKFLNEHNKITASKNTNVNTTAIQVKQYSDNQKQKFNGISKLSLFVSTTSNESLTIAENTPIIEYMGEIDLFKNYVRDPVNQYSTWGVTKPKVLKSTLQTHENEPLDIVLDSRFVGNESRFIRKSCPTSSNCRIERIYIPEDNSFRFLVVTTKPIKLKSETADEELRLEWEWDPEHPILKLYKNNNSEKFELLSNADKSALITYIDNILHFAECGCSTANGFSTCAIFKIKKATSYLLRSTRKASSISNVNLTKSKEELILPRREKEYISWNERLLERDNIIQMNLSVTADESDEEMIEEKEAEVVGTKESDVEEYVKEPKPTALFKLPYKKQLISKNRNLLRNMEKIESNHVKVEPSSYITDDDLPFPIVSDLVIRIEKNIDEKLKPMVQEVEEKISTVLESLPMVTEEEKPVAVIDIVKVVEEEEPAPVQQPSPKIVKKLSFADYKKKLK